MDEMLKREYVNKYLFDILTAILEIETFLSGRRRLFRDFCDDIMLHRAIERNIEIIGEAAGRILKLDAGTPLTDARKALDARNFVAHGYDRIDDEILWSIVINDLPQLKEAVLTLLPPPEAEGDSVGTL